MTKLAIRGVIAVLLVAVSACGSDHESSSRSITSFAFGDPAAAGSIDEASRTVAVVVPHGTDLRSLAPIITHTGVRLAPASGVAQDFTLPVTYTVTAEDGSTRDYLVTVTLAPCLTVFTTGTDTLSTTDGSLTYTATLGGDAPTLTANDSLHGAGNPIVISDTSSATSQDLLPPGLDLTGVPSVTLITAGNAGVDAGRRFDLSGFAGVSRFALTASGAQGDFLEAGPGIALTVQTASATVDVAGGFSSLALGGGSLSALNLSGTAGAVTLTDPEGPTSLTIQASGLALTGGVTDASDHLTSLTIAGSGATSSIDTITGGALTSLGVTGGVSLGSAGSPAALPAGLTTVDLSGDPAPCQLQVSSGGSVILGRGDNTLVIAPGGSASGSVTTGTGYDTIDLGSHAGYVLHLGTDAGFASDPTRPNAVIEHATGGVFVEFTGIPSLTQYAFFGSFGSSAGKVIAYLQTVVTGNPRSAAAATFGGNTYIVASATGVPGPTDTVIVELTGLHGIDISISGGAQIVLTN